MYLKAIGELWLQVKLFGESYGAMANRDGPRAIPWWVSGEGQLEIYHMCLASSRGTADCIFGVTISECQGIMGTWLLTIGSAIVLLSFLLEAFWVTVPGESELSSLTCNLTAPFVILHNCCHPGKTKWFFSLVISPTLSLEPFGQDRQWGTWADNVQIWVTPRRRAFDFIFIYLFILFKFYFIF